jgi:Zn-finger nucleic acid-binding protein
MARCPVCGSVRVVIVVAASPRAFCSKCGSRWIQEGSTQRQVERNGMAATPFATEIPDDASA